MTDFPKTSVEVAKNFEQSVNTTAYNPHLAARYIANRAHRYLCNEIFHFFLHLIYFLSDNYKKGWYDPRNEYACKTANAIVELMDSDTELKWCRVRYNSDVEYYKDHEVEEEY